MSIQYVTEQLNSITNAKKENRQSVANIVLEQKESIKDLVNITFDINNDISIKAAWILEWICTHHHINYISPYLDKFTANIGLLKFDSAIRPCAKICELIANAYFAKTENKVKKTLQSKHIDAIIETGFDWLITPQKIAVRAYTMTCLYLFGLEKNWVHNELKHLIQTKIIHESKGTKARGKHILACIEKHEKTHL